MEAGEVIKGFEDYLFSDNILRSELAARVLAGKDHFVLDFIDLIKHTPTIGEELLDKPQDTLKCAEIACANVEPGLPKYFRCRIKNIPPAEEVPINQIRHQHIGKFVTLDGTIKQKTKVHSVARMIEFSCDSCGKTLIVAQEEEEKIRKPTMCACGRKSGFKPGKTTFKDYFVMLLEENAENLDGSNKLENINIKCAEDLTNKSIERYLVQGVNVKVTGILKQEAVVKDGKQVNIFRYFLDANYIKINEEDLSRINWTHEEVEQFYELAEKSNTVPYLIEQIWPTVVGRQMELTGILLSMVGGVKRKGAVKGTERPDIHILMAGDASVGKSHLMKYAQRVVPKGMYFSGGNVSGAGLTVAIERNEITGERVADAGAVVLCSNGTLFLDEMDKVNDDDRKRLHEAMEQQQVSVSKAGVHCVLPAQTTIIAAMNPKHSNFSKHDAYKKQLDIEESLMSRFDLIFVMEKTDLNRDDEERMIDLKRLSSMGEIQTELEPAFIKKYLAFCKKTVQPVITESLFEKIKMVYKELLEASEKGQESFIVTPRLFDALKRLTEASAKIKLHKEATEDDVKIAAELVIKSLRKLGIEPGSALAVEFIDVDGQRKKIMGSDIRARLTRLFRKLCQGQGMCSKKDIFAIMENEGYNMETLNKYWKKLRQEGTVTEPKMGQYKMNDLEY